MLEKLIALRQFMTVQDEKGERGATATEYALLVAFIAFGIVLAVGLFGDALAGFFGELTTTVGGWDGSGTGAN
ncbi:Flp family type IVb pilin [Nocardioides sp. SYSU D00065]|uniref:Flp family type IVb pilin n=1 Tax=Nocardioides sp. SYSU D00065 TaxID=2817378 RepID=UPI001B31B9DE|nr:Flp family type IVb pilin [Nocardioides sp. SYSU D00065]